ncbi:allantoate permease [Aspergillus nomiae NRRL 13137]|uniref:Allantoate permease n=1 Tax=Aspergillus nomiae NRRL (strain ATCC 15546 / NRRL 13137 / CBS 260.88 / M93) TaxID=1509407 RepID=A0A0L1ITV8_ASPN3|nr:allantoate permease [Aspergillus nomiae NRRL 13137]KNG82996.1 allantoate permease [Aspergillus nomiae NRRL 13137]
MADIDSKSSSSHVENPTKPISPEAIQFEGLSDEEALKLERQLVRKIDFHLIPALFLLFIFNILDRSNIANARLGGLQEDLGLSDTQYQTAVAIMFVGYLLGQVPSNIILTRVSRRAISQPPFSCGAESPSAWLQRRTMLEFYALLMSSWYKASELAVRVAIVYCGNTVANGFGGMLAAGILSGLDGKGGLAGWRWLFIIEGAGTMVAGLLAVVLLPDFPRSGQRKWLTQQEQRFAEWRLAVATNNEVDENGSIRQGLKDAVTDPKVWALVLIQICQLTSQTWTYFFPSIVETLGFGKIVTLLITAPVYVFGFLGALGNSLIANRTNYRAVLIVWPLCIDIVGNVMVISSHATAVRYVGMFLMCMGSYSAFNVVQAWIASTIPRTRTKRAIVYAMVNFFGNSSNIYGSYFFPTKDSPQYRPGGIILSSFAAGGVCFSILLAVYLYWLNTKARKAEDEDGQIRYKYIF